MILTVKALRELLAKEPDEMLIGFDDAQEGPTAATGVRFQTVGIYEDDMSPSGQSVLCLILENEHYNA